MRIFICGVNGFIGSSLLEVLLKKHTVSGVDLQSHKIEPFLSHPQFHFFQADMTQEMSWVEQQIMKADVVLPLAAIANPALYVTDPLRVFALDFEANLPLVRLCVKHKKRLVFPSTSEVYGMCPDTVFDEETSPLVVGPIGKERWIYSASKQLLDRVIYAHGIRDTLDYTLFRPFNWIGPQLDTISLEKGGQGRVLVQFLGNIIRGKDIFLVDGGQQRRCFTDIADGVSALCTMIENEKGCASRRIFNIGNPKNDVSIQAFATQLLELTRQHPLCPPLARHTQIQRVSGEDQYGPAYQDIPSRVPAICQAQKHLGWTPQVPLKDSLMRTVDYHLKRLFK